MTRWGAVLTAALIVPATLALPVAGAGAGPREAVTPTVRSVALAGIDPVGLRESPGPAETLPIIGDPTRARALPAVDDGARHSHRDPEVALRPAAVTAPADVEPFGLVGITAAAPFDPDTRVLIRVREDDDWSRWAEVPISEHRPDPGTEEDRGARYATEPLVTDGADGVQVRIDTPDGSIPADTRLTMIDNPVTADDEAIGSASVPISTANAAARQPRIISRSEWGADESLRRGTTSYSPNVKVAFVHHVVSSNNYSPAQAAQQMRNVYSWFTQGIGVNDFGYNFVVDRFGNLYEGRAGGIDRAVIGAHTQGFNAETFAVSFLGNADTLDPTRSEADTIVSAIASLIAWKFSIHHVDPASTAVLTSAGPGPGQGGTSQYWPGEKVTIETIAGHGDIGLTGCPGTFLKPYVPRLRSLVADVQGAIFFAPTVSGSGASWASSTPITVTPRTNAPLDARLEILNACGDRVRTIRGASGTAGTFSLAWDLRDGSGKPVPPGRYTLVLTGSSGGEELPSWTGVATIKPTASSPPDPCTPPEEFTVSGTGYGHGVGLSQWGAYGQALEGRSARQIVQHYYPGTNVQAYPDDVDVRIGLLYQVSAAQARTESLASGGGGLQIDLGTRPRAGTPGAVYSFGISDGKVLVRSSVGGVTTAIGRAGRVTLRWSGTSDPGGAGSVPTLLNVIGPGESFDSLYHRYRYGTVEITTVPTSSGPRLAVVNVLSLHDEYLLGIAEVIPSWPQPALQAQVIASRSYALAKYASGVRSACDCHMDDGGGPYYDQTFRGWAVESGPSGDNWAEAVRGTAVGSDRGLTALYDGAPIPAFYTASTNGRTNGAAEVWGGNGYPWSVSVDDRWSLAAPGNPYVSWLVTVSQARMGQVFGVSDIMTIEVTDTLKSGAARTITATTYDGARASVAATTFRYSLGLKSTYIGGISGDAPAPADLPGRSSLVRRPKGPIPSGTTITLRGRVKPAMAGMVVQRQVRSGSGEWQNRETAVVDESGRFRFSVLVAPAGATYAWRVLVYSAGSLYAMSKERKGSVV